MGQARASQNGRCGARVMALSAEQSNDAASDREQHHQNDHAATAATAAAIVVAHWRDR